MIKEIVISLGKRVPKQSIKKSIQEQYPGVPIKIEQDIFAKRMGRSQHHIVDVIPKDETWDPNKLEEIEDNIFNIINASQMILYKGTLVEGTIKPLPRIFSILELLNEHEIKHSVKEEELTEDNPDLEWILDELCDIVEEHIPPNHYIGSHYGDGADFGIWEVWGV